MAKENEIHVMEYCLAIKRKEILPFVTTWMSLEGIILSKISETEKKKNTVRLHLYEKSKKKKKKTEHRRTGFARPSKWYGRLILRRPNLPGGFSGKGF